MRRRTVMCTVLSAAVVFLFFQPAAAANISPDLKRNKALNEAFATLNKSAAPSTVEIQRRWSGRRLGLGVIVSADGDVITSLALVGVNNEFKVRMSDNSVHVCKVVARDHRNDLALLRMRKPPKDLSVLKPGKGKDLEVGRFVISPSPGKKPAAVGVVSSPVRRIPKCTLVPFLGLFSILTDENKGPKRDYPEVIQHDSPVTHRNIGGPLVDSGGRIVGVNVAAAWRGVSYAVPWETIEKMLPTLKKGRDVQANGVIGVRIKDADESLLEGSGVKDGGGVLVSEAVEDMPAEKAGLKAGDIITHVKGLRVRTVEEMVSIIKYITPGKKVKVKLFRIGMDEKKEKKDEQLIEIEVEVTERP